MKIRRFLPLLILGIAVFAALSGIGDFRRLTDHLLSLHLVNLALALVLAIANYFLRYLRWRYYLQLLSVQVPTKVNVLVFASGLAIALTPGKVGELSKAFLLRDLAGIPVTVSAPAVVMERITDVLAIATLSLGALLLFPFGIPAIFAGIATLVALVFLLARGPTGVRFLRLPILRRWRPELENSLSSLGILRSPKALLIAQVLGTLAWLSEGIALWMVVRGLDLSLPLIEAVPVYAAATLVGALSLLPGGLIGTEGTMVVLLTRLDLTTSGASASTLLVRLVTLWFGLLLGMLSLLWLQRLPHWSGLVGQSSSALQN